MSSDSKTFCILPFVHLYAEPKGEMKPCCIAGGFDEPLNLKELSLEDAFNSPQMKELRKDMMEGRRNKVCDVCYKKEDSTGTSPRFNFNENTLWKLPEIKEDFSVDTQFQHIDIRFSNLCNFKCRMCNHDFSSNWYEDNEKISPGYTKGKTKVMRVSDTIVEDLIPHLNNVKSFYFAGGEPLMMPEHYRVLKHLYDTMPVIEQHWGSKRNLSIHYNTNLSVIKYDEQDLVDLWKGFDRVFLSISCDGVGEVGEYQRVGFKHDRFIENLKTIQKYFRPESPYAGEMGMQYNFQYTTTVWNVYHIFDFIQFMTENNFINSSEQIDFYYAWVPYHVALNNISQSEKDRLVEFLKNGMKTISVEKTISELNTLIKFINLDSNIDNPVENIVGYTSDLDKLHNTDSTKLNGIDFHGMLLRNISE
jgi:hypothetical protein